MSGDASPDGIIGKALGVVVGAVMGALAALGTWRVRMAQFEARQRELETRTRTIERRQIIAFRVQMEIARESGVRRQWDADWAVFMQPTEEVHTRYAEVSDV